MLFHCFFFFFFFFFIDWYPDALKEAMIEIIGQISWAPFWSGYEFSCMDLQPWSAFVIIQSYTVPLRYIIWIRYRYFINILYLFNSWISGIRMRWRKPWIGSRLSLDSRLSWFTTPPVSNSIILQRIRVRFQKQNSSLDLFVLESLRGVSINFLFGHRT